MSFALGMHARFPANPSGINSEEVVQAWRDHAQEIATIEHTRISDRTPEDTGTLDSSITEVLNPDPQTIASIYFDPDVQATGPWSRIYAQYQEDLPLGTRTYTPQHAQMIWRVQIQDLGVIGTWAKATAQEGTNKMLNGVGEEEI